MKNLNVLIVTTSHDKLGNTGEKTGVWLEELAAPYYNFINEGAVVTIASPKGGIVPLDPTSKQPDWQTEYTKQFNNDTVATAAIQDAKKISDINPSEYDVLFFPGGHGPMWDLSDNSEVAKLITAFNTEDKPIGLVCHGVAALKGVMLDNNTPLVKGRRLTSFTNTEEAAVQLTEVVPFLLETELTNDGAIYRKGDDWSEFVIEDGNLITGQNPQSSVLAAKKTLEAVQVN
ncbi:type 1 glutamine amidotransferase domain-containing protein [Aquimarina sp. AD10]|uniref:type 1 glutamine amidotransferase domain-containing protein n=1 Tax=Aquimarina TaxID=290174 RepID=UPI000E4BE62C|nr:MULTISPECIES: type 1 glutamine amidotransferase domain-containing protein [Aquimarina]AXT60784.1 type 1 glutamine amidotransferase domain-containing protein [Aquimarina sp. AD10]RKM98516.1 type 1 glutamine amidotransferase domain-containing protein [Aquimarina sp. AD10]